MAFKPIPPDGYEYVSDIPNMTSGQLEREQRNAQSWARSVSGEPESDVDKWRRELAEAGWVAESATRWRSPDGALWRGPYGAWIELQRQRHGLG